MVLIPLRSPKGVFIKENIELKEVIQNDHYCASDLGEGLISIFNCISLGRRVGGCSCVIEFLGKSAQIWVKVNHHNAAQMD